ncbi:MAG: ABC transporter ATP-binding protein [Deltaproteobacteria bacterium]|nr:ABC transporter ATP-binding protein [Deltaproteobacteria bacterium]
MIVIDQLRVDLPGFRLNEVSLEVGQGEFFALIGPTGSGKTLTLEAVAGLVALTSGRIFLAGRDITFLPPERRRIGIVYQDCALFPHLTVAANIAYGLRYHQDRGPQEKGLVVSLARQLGIDHLLGRRPTTLSGGERQRVALARALAVRPEVLLLDEPLSALDPNFREGLRSLIKTIHQDTGVTVLMVSHDFGEVLYLADKGAVIRQGRIEQTGPMADIFHRPKTEFVAGFVGVKNIIPCSFGNGLARLDGADLRLDRPLNRGTGKIAIRPEDIRLQIGRAPREEVNTLTGRIVDLIDLGQVAEVRVSAAGLEFKCQAQRSLIFNPDYAPGSQVWLTVPPEAIHIL